jgi:uncharacterized RDD family membrane protein YckC
VGDGWYVSRGRKKFGPIQWGDLQSMAQRGEILASDSLWTEGLVQWSPAASIVGTNAGVSDRTPVNEIRHRAQTGPMEYAGFWVRFAAYLIDTIILAVVQLFLVVLLIRSGQIEMSKGVPVQQPLLLPLLSGGIFWMYFAGMESSALQATFGKMMLGLKVTDLSGGKISFARATGRYFGKIISSLLLCIGYLMIVFTGRNQALHDLMAGCLVIREK